MSDTLIKIAVSVLSALLLALGGWVWQTGADVATLSIQKDQIIRDIERVEESQKSMQMKQESLQEDMTGTQKRLYGMERDIDYIRVGIDDIKKDLAELKK